jgi:hypothetical protein
MTQIHCNTCCPCAISDVKTHAAHPDRGAALNLRCPRQLPPHLRITRTAQPAQPWAVQLSRPSLPAATTAALLPLQGRVIGGSEQVVTSKVAFSMYEFCHTPHVCQEQRRRGIVAVAKYGELFQGTSCYQHVDAKNGCDTRRLYVHALCMQVCGGLGRGCPPPWARHCRFGWVAGFAALSAFGLPPCLPSLPTLPQSA